MRYQTVFSIFLIAMAFLCRESTGLVYPQILYLLALMLSFNFAANFSLRVWPERKGVAALVIVGNCAVITGILAYSGGPESNLWVLYLLPIYTVCLLLDGREVLWITAGIVSFNWTIYASRVGVWTEVIAFELGVKSGILVLSAAAIWGIVRRERSAREGLEAKRREVAELESGFEQTRKLAELGEVSSGIAHDLNSPLGAILGTVELLRANPELSGQIKPDIDRISRAAELCKSIAGNILGFVRKEPWVVGPCSINEIVDSAASLCAPQLGQRKVKLELDLAPGLPEVSASLVHLQRVILNLVSNAAQAIGKGGAIMVATGLREGFVKITVEDTGPGIPERVLKSLFNRFQTTKAPGEGTGLGLYLCREILIKHGGSISAENRPEGGARFIIALPGLLPAMRARALSGSGQAAAR